MKTVLLVLLFLLSSCDLEEHAKAYHKQEAQALKDYRQTLKKSIETALAQTNEDLDSKSRCEVVARLVKPGCEMGVGHLWYAECMERRIDIEQACLAALAEKGLE